MVFTQKTKTKRIPRKQRDFFFFFCYVARAVRPRQQTTDKQKAEMRFSYIKPYPGLRWTPNGDRFAKLKTTDIMDCVYGGAELSTIVFIFRYVIENCGMQISA